MVEYEATLVVREFEDGKENEKARWQGVVEFDESIADTVLVDLAYSWGVRHKMSAWQPAKKGKRI